MDNSTVVIVLGALLLVSLIVNAIQYFIKSDSKEQMLYFKERADALMKSNMQLTTEGDILKKNVEYLKSENVRHIDRFNKAQETINNFEKENAELHAKLEICQDLNPVAVKVTPISKSNTKSTTKDIEEELTEKGFVQPVVKSKRPYKKRTK